MMRRTRAAGLHRSTRRRLLRPPCDPTSDDDASAAFAPSTRRSNTVEGQHGVQQALCERSFAAFVRAAVTPVTLSGRTARAPDACQPAAIRIQFHLAAEASPLQQAGKASRHAPLAEPAAALHTAVGRVMTMACRVSTAAAATPPQVIPHRPHAHEQHTQQQPRLLLMMQRSDADNVQPRAREIQPRTGRAHEHAAAHAQWVHPVPTRVGTVAPPVAAASTSAASHHRSWNDM